MSRDASSRRIVARSVTSRDATFACSALVNPARREPASNNAASVILGPEDPITGGLASSTTASVDPAQRGLAHSYSVIREAALIHSTPVDQHRSAHFLQ